MFATLLEKIQALTNTQKSIACSAIIVLLAGAFVWYVFLPKRALINQQQDEIAVLNTDINIRRTKARRLEALKKEYEMLKRQLIALEKHLPPEEEVELLLKQVSELGEKNGLLIKLWKPQTKKPNASGIYTEIPMTMEVNGGYHSVGSFFERISELPRIVNVSNIKIGGAKTEAGRFSIETSFLATTFAVIEKTEETSPPPS